MVCLKSTVTDFFPRGRCDGWWFLWSRSMVGGITQATHTRSTFDESAIHAQQISLWNTWDDQQSLRGRSHVKNDGSPVRVYYAKVLQRLGPRVWCVKKEIAGNWVLPHGTAIPQPSCCARNANQIRHWNVTTTVLQPQCGTYGFLSHSKNWAEEMPLGNRTRGKISFDAVFGGSFHIKIHIFRFNLIFV